MSLKACSYLCFKKKKKFKKCIFYGFKQKFTVSLVYRGNQFHISPDMQQRLMYYSFPSQFITLIDLTIKRFLFLCLVHLNTELRERINTG